jgi:hypothetical protein
LLSEATTNQEFQKWAWRSQEVFALEDLKKRGRMESGVEIWDFTPMFLNGHETSLDDDSW